MASTIKFALVRCLKNLLCRPDTKKADKIARSKSAVALSQLLQLAEAQRGNK